MRSLAKAVMVLTCPLVTIMLIGCSNSDEGSDPYVMTRLPGWTAETHSTDGNRDYETVFAQDTVKRIDLIITANDWQLMMDDMDELLGEFGAGGQIPPLPNAETANEAPTAGQEFEQLPNVPGEIPPEALEACEGLEEGDPCTITVPIMGEIEGTCQPVMGLACVPGGGIPPISGREQDRNPIWRPCTFVFEDNVWWQVGVRFKGNSSLTSTWGSGIYKLPFRFDFDQFETQLPSIWDQRFFGFKKLTLSSNWKDASLIREKVTADIFREAGVPSPMTAFYRLYIDHGQGPIYFGLYTMVEIPADPMFDSQFAEDGGNLYKPSGPGADFVQFEQESFEKETNEEAADWSDVIAVFEALHADIRLEDPAAWRSALEEVLNTDAFLRWLAVNTVIQNWDTYGIMTHNYYLYGDPAEAGRLLWIPWDNNMALSDEMGMSAPLSLSLSEVSDQWPLIRYLMDDPHYHDLYLSFVHEIMSGAFSLDFTAQRYYTAHDLIRPYVVGAEGELPGYTLLTDTASFDNELGYLLNHLDGRGTTAIDFLNQEGFVPAPIVINEIHYHSPLAESDGSDNYEFVEIYNSGGSTIDLSGYAFTDGVEFTFPSGVTIAPQEYVLIASNGDLYSGQGYQVFQWQTWRLANEGEAIQLKDAQGVQIDYVIFDDEAPWPALADGGGPSLELMDPSLVNSLPANWQASDVQGGTPGEPNS